MALMRCLIGLLALLTAVSATAADAQVYRYVAPDGTIHYTDKPRDKTSKPVQLPPLQTYKSTGRGNFDIDDIASTPKPQGTAQFALSIESPTPEETYREANPQITLAVSVLPGLISGYGFIYAVNGQAQNEEPIDQTSYAITGLERGSHTLSATLVNPKGDSIATSSVTVHIKPPIVRP